MTAHDVIIVGAGPAGSTAAASLARRGHDVLLVDRAEFPRDKPCGDGIPPGTVGILHDLGLREGLDTADFTRVRAVRLVSAKGRDFTVPFDPKRDDTQFLIARRVQFDDLLRRHAIASGAHFERVSVRAPVMENGVARGVEVESDGSGREIRARHVIAADGATSALGRALSPARAVESQRGVAIRAYLDGIDTRTFAAEFHFQGPLAPGYAWIFPLGTDRANVGVIMRTDRFKRCGATLQQLLQRFLDSPDVKPRLASDARLYDPATWQLPYATPSSGARAAGGVLFAGDAGRFIDSMTGEGIHHAVATAAIAADVVHEALDAPHRAVELLADYDRRCDAAIGGLIRRSYRAQKYVASHPALLEALFIGARASRGQVVSWINRVSTDFLVR
ncbi:MAG TPA: geranylgeranyl reductase family protein [Candidatus Krumholzibacteria bacterium]|nr:geranylgeranyl reductase family protein [Candidatus Krumholzibacteria bacterium]